MMRIVSRLRRKTASGLLVLALAGSPAAADLRVGVFGQDPPMSFVDAQGQLVGFDIDIARALCEAVKFECELVQTDWSALLPGLVERRLDVVVASVAVTDARRALVAFTRPYYSSAARFVVRRDSFDAIDPEALAGKRIGVWRDTTFDRYLEDNYAANSQIVRYSTQPGALLDLLVGRIDAVLADEVTLQITFLGTDYGAEFELVGPPVDDPRWLGYGNAVAVGKENEGLRRLFDRAVADIHINGVFERIRRKWLGEHAALIRRY
jgi:ABC-type amino acid transport substrate-binding protein